MKPYNKVRCPQVYRAVNGGILMAWRKGGAPSHAAQQCSLSAPHPYQHCDPRAAPLLQPSSSQTLPVSSSIYFQPSRFLSICSRNPLAILCPDGRLQMKGAGSWRVFSWPVLGSLLELGGRLSPAQTRLCCAAKALQSLSTVLLNALFVFKQICLKPFNGLCFPGAYFAQSTPYKAAESQ